ncbi:ankyrin repeat domain-containing protein [Rhodococcus sp. NPDC058532]|uniref:ankyrin repeat domain-containing protein n=1 Tax=Rhodococcus sp. NPDC058532 TaxID=3346540 RepID=UPI003659A022
MENPTPQAAADAGTAPPMTPEPAVVSNPGPPVSTPELERALFAAAVTDDADSVRAAVRRGAAIEARDDGGRTPLVAATKANAAAAAAALIAAGADVNAKDDMQDSAFLYAGAEGLDEILAGTLGHGADVRSINRFGGTALIPAAEHGLVETVRTLIRAGVPVNHVNHPGWTALLEAVVYGDGSARYVDVVGQLLDAGADPTIRDSQGRTVLQHARGLGQHDIVALLVARDGT